MACACLSLAHNSTGPCDPRLQLEALLRLGNIFVTDHLLADLVHLLTTDLAKPH